jgi:hypothetical protein
MHNPEEWAGNQHTQTNQQRGLTIWIANNAYGFALYDGLSWHNCPKIELSSLWRGRLWRAWNGKGRTTREKARQIVSRFDDRLLANDNVVSLRHR